MTVVQFQQMHNSSWVGPSHGSLGHNWSKSRFACSLSVVHEHQLSFSISTSEAHVAYEAALYYGHRPGCHGLAMDWQPVFGHVQASLIIVREALLPCMCVAYQSFYTHYEFGVTIDRTDATVARASSPRLSRWCAAHRCQCVSG